MFSNLRSAITQFFPPKAPLTEENLPSQTGKVFIVTGGGGGLGFELSKILYCAGGTVYIMSYHEGRSLAALEAIKNSAEAKNSTPGVVKWIKMDLADLSTIPTAVAIFREQETRLDVLFNNAGVASKPLDYKTVQGLEPHFGINCVGHFLLTKLLYPLLEETVKFKASPNTVRVIWTSSVLVDLAAPKGGVKIEQLSNPSKDRNEHYTASKTANWFLASEFHRRFGESGVISITQNPGSLRTTVWRTTPRYYYYPFYPILSNPIDGAHTSLWSGFSNDVTIKDGGRYVMPFGRWHHLLRADLLAALKEEKDGGTGQAQKFWDWCEKTVAPFVPADYKTEETSVIMPESH